jgi:hypothetical protein
VIATPAGGTRDSAFHVARTDARGRFTLDSMPDGAWTLLVEHPLTDTLGFDVPPRDVMLPRDAETAVALALPSAATLRRALCPAALADTSLGIVLGVVRRPDGSPAPGARVVVAWTDYTVNAATRAVIREERTASVATDSLGVYRACGVPAAMSLLVQAQAGTAAQSGVVEERISEAGVLVRHLTVGATFGAAPAGPGLDTATAVAIASGIATGVVTSGRTGIAGAQVRLFGTDRVATTNARGEFRLAGLPTGTQGFEVSALGYSLRRFRAEVGASTPSVTVQLDRIAAVLDSVRVTARRQYDRVRYGEYEQRLARGLGRFVTEEAIARQHPFLVSDMLRTTVGYGVIVGRDGRVTVAANRGVFTLRGALRSSSEHPLTAMGGKSAGGAACPTVYIDGVESADGDVDRVLPGNVRGIEIYREGEVPVKYRALCGAILIWTK